MSSRPTATPRRCSARAPRLASLSHTTGMPSREDSASENGSFTQPRLGANVTAAVAQGDRPRHGHPDAHAAPAALVPQRVLDHLREGLHDAQHVVLAAVVRPLAARQHLATEADAGHRVAVDTEVDPDDGDVVARLHDVAGAAVAAGADRAGLADEAEVDERGGQVADRAAVQPQVPGERGARRRAPEVDARQHAPHVVALELLRAQGAPRRDVAPGPSECAAGHVVSPPRRSGDSADCEPSVCCGRQLWEPRRRTILRRRRSGLVEVQSQGRRSGRRPGRGSGAVAVGPGRPGEAPAVDQVLEPGHDLAPRPGSRRATPARTPARAPGRRTGAWSTTRRRRGRRPRRSARRRRRSRAGPSGCPRRSPHPDARAAAGSGRRAADGPTRGPRRPRPSSSPTQRPTRDVELHVTLVVEDGGDEQARPEHVLPVERGCRCGRRGTPAASRA